MSRARDALAGAAVAVAALGCLEGLLWLAGVPTLRQLDDPYYGFSRRSPAFEEDRARGRFVTSARAAHALNVQEFPSRKPPKALRVFVLGGSSAYGFPWGGEVAFPAALARALQASHPDRPVEMINAAGMSYGSHRLRVLAH